MTCGIYMLRSSSGNCYIGSSKCVENRMKDHLNGAKAGKNPNKKLNDAYKKYKNFEQIVLLMCREQDLIFYEQICIDAYQPQYNRSMIAGKIEQTEDVVRKRKSPENVAKHRAGLKSYWGDPENVAKHSAIMKSRWSNPENVAKQCAVLKVRWSNPDYAERHSSLIKENWKDPAYLERHREASLKYWQDSQLYATRIFPLVLENPRRKRTHGFRSLSIILENPGIRYKDFLQAGGRSQDVLWDKKRNRVRIEIDDKGEI